VGSLCGRGGIAYEEGCVEGRNHADNVEEEPVPTARHTEDSLIWKFGLEVTLSLPCSSEPDVGQADSTPNEEVRETG